MNIYLISANSYHLIKEEINKIVVDQTYLLINLNKSNLSDVLEEASYVSLTSEKKYLVVSNADFFGSAKMTDNEQMQLIKYLNNPNPQTIIIFTTLESLDSRKKVLKTLKENGKIINIEPWDKKRMREEANKYLAKYKYQADYDTISYILANTYSNIDILYNELDKIMLYYAKPSKIALSDVEKIVGQEIDRNNFHFVSAVIDKNLKEALRLLKSLKVYKVETLTLINLLAREYRLMFMVKKLMQQHKSSMTISQELGLQNWQVDKLYQNGLKYNEKEILKNISLLGQIDLKIKKGEYDKDLALYPFLLEVCI